MDKSSLVQTFKVLGDENRLKIIKMLASEQVNSVCVTEIAKRLKITQQAASQHLKLMKLSGFLVSEKRGFHVYYRIDMLRFKEMKQGMDQLFLMAFRKCENCEERDSCKDRIL